MGWRRWDECLKLGLNLDAYWLKLFLKRERS